MAEDDVAAATDEVADTVSDAVVDMVVVGEEVVEWLRATARLRLGVNMSPEDLLSAKTSPSPQPSSCLYHHARQNSISSQYSSAWLPMADHRCLRT